MPVGKKLFLVQEEENVKKQIQILEIKNESKICILYQGSTFLLLKSTFQEKWTKSRKVLKVLKKNQKVWPIIVYMCYLLLASKVYRQKHWHRLEAHSLKGRSSVGLSPGLTKPRLKTGTGSEDKHGGQVKSSFTFSKQMWKNKFKSWKWKMKEKFEF